MEAVAVEMKVRGPLAPGLVRALAAEELKLRRTLALALVVIAPLVIAVLQGVMLDDCGLDCLQGKGDVWLWFSKQSMLFWALLMMPLFITLQTALIANLDHGARAWKHLFAQPVSRGAIYTAKLIAGTVLIALSMLGMVFFTAMVGSVLRALHPEYGFEAAIPWGFLFQLAGIIFAGSWFILTLHNWVALRWGNFVVPSAVGITLTVIALMVSNSDFWVQYYPWSLPAFMVERFWEGGFAWHSLAIGFGGGWVIALMGGWLFVRRDIL